MKLVLEGEEVRRNYSLSARGDSGQYRISVKREAGGRVSNYLHDQFQVGATIDHHFRGGDFAAQHFGNCPQQAGTDNRVMLRQYLIYKDLLVGMNTE